MTFGMRYRQSFDYAVEHQMGEAVAIARESRSGRILMNSKSEYNRCRIARITMQSKKETHTRLRERNQRETVIALKGKGTMKKNEIEKQK